MLYVVEFTDESVEVVPQKWMPDCGMWSYWPPLRAKALDRPIQQQKTPDQRWKNASVKKVMRKCGTFSV